MGRVLLNSCPSAEGRLSGGGSQYFLAGELVNFPALSTRQLIRSPMRFSAAHVKRTTAIPQGFRAGKENPLPSHRAENYIAVSLRDGPPASARMDQGGRCCRVPESPQGYGVWLHQGENAGGTATQAARDHLRIDCKHSQTAGAAGGIIEP